jgi:FkbM family methyltransferase
MSSYKEIIAFEPNYDSWKYLSSNMRILPIKAEAIQKGVSNFTGKAMLAHPDFDTHDHAAFIVPSSNGDIDITRIDDIKLSEEFSLLLKIDVEGEELSVIEGSRETIKSAKNVIILFEAHYKQVKRSGVDPTKILSYLSEIRSFNAVVTENPDVKIDLNEPFFDQFQDGIYNISVFSI